MRWIGIALACAVASLARAEPGPLKALLTQAEATRALDRVLLQPQRFALRNGPSLENLRAIVVCSGERFTGGYTFRIVFEQLEGERTRFDYLIEDGELTRLSSAIYPAQATDPSVEARVDLTQSPPVVTQRTAKESRKPIALPWKGDELGELFLLFVLTPLADCGLEARPNLRVVQELSLLGSPERSVPLARNVALTTKDGTLRVAVNEGDRATATVQLGTGSHHGEIARLVFTDGLYADPITETTYNQLHHAVPVRMAPPAHQAALDTLRTVAAAQWLYTQRNQGAGTLAELEAANLIDNALAAGQTLGWKIELALSEDRQQWIARATPAYRETPACVAIRETGELVVAPLLLPLDPAKPFPAEARREPRRSRR